MTPDMDHGTCDFYKNMFRNVIFQIQVFDVQTQNSSAEVFQVQVLYCEFLRNFESPQLKLRNKYLIMSGLLPFH